MKIKQQAVCFGGAPFDQDGGLFNRLWYRLSTQSHSCRSPLDVCGLEYLATRIGQKSFT